MSAERTDFCPDCGTSPCQHPTPDPRRAVTMALAVGLVLGIIVGLLLSAVTL